tara:strand:- start:45 stop:1847 length:1803 start_codon:yes stop_codon:yes gene_type:complete
MAYQVPDIAGGLRSSRAQAYARRERLITRMIQQQNQRDLKAAALAKQAQSEVADFYTHFEKQPRSADLMFNTAAEEFVRKKAIAQEEAYELAYGPRGTAELRANYNAMVARDKRQLVQVGEWMVLANAGNAQLDANTGAINIGNEVGRFTRSSSDAISQKYAFQTNLAGNNFSTLSLDDDDYGNVILTGANSVMKEPMTRNLSSDVANAKKGLDWFTSIEEGDKLAVVGGKQWNVGIKDGNQTLVDPLKNAFKQQEIEYTSYNEEKNITTTTLKKVYSKDNIVNRLTNKNLGDEYLGDRLNSTINGANFEKQWDQLYRGGYVRSKTDDSLKYFGSISWDMVGKMRTLSYDDLVKQLEPQRNEFDSDKKFETASEQFKSFIKDVDADGNNILDDTERQGFVNQMRNAARHGLANYYAEQLAPASENETIKTRTVEGKPDNDSDTDGLTAGARLSLAIHKEALRANKDSAKNIISNLKDYKNEDEITQAILDEMKKNARLEKTKDGSTMAKHSYVTYDQANDLLDDTNQDDVVLSEGALYRMEPVYTTVEGEKVMQFEPVMIARPSTLKAARGDEKELRKLLNNAMNVDAKAETYYSVNLPD